MVKATNAIREYATIAFTLLGVLFGMMIMTFIFGNLGTSTSTTFADGTLTVTNESQNSTTIIVFSNETGYFLAGSAHSNYTGATISSVLGAYNQTNGTPDSIASLPGPYNESIDLGNFTLDSVGNVTNASNLVYPNLSITYAETFKTENELTADEINNDSLQAIASYTAQSDTQLNTVAIAIILVILIGVFLLFWQIFVGKSGKGKGSGSQFG